MDVASPPPPPRILILELVGALAGTLGRNSRCVFKAADGTIGRAADCSWVLSEESISATHARITFTDPGFTLTDTSRNGISLIDSDEPLEKGKPFAIGNGMGFLIGDFEIKATLLDESGLPLDATPPTGTEGDLD